MSTPSRFGEGWAPADACTLPLGDQAGRFAEFDEVFAKGLREARRLGPEGVRLRFTSGPEVDEQVRDLVEREADCCSFFDFTVERQSDGLVVDVRVPVGRTAVLDGLLAQAEAAL